jgi:hypothetical protein
VHIRQFLSHAIAPFLALHRTGGDSDLSKAKSGRLRDFVTSEDDAHCTLFALLSAP